MYRKLEKLELEKEYSPSSCIEDIQVYIARYAERSAQALWWARETQSVLENLSYGSSDAEKLDLFVPHCDVTNSKTLYIYLHGGVWQELDKSVSGFAATNFQQHGDYFAVINYALLPDVNLAEIIEQNRRAIAYLYENASSFGFDPKRIVLIGSSGGAHIAAMMCATHWPKWRSDNDIKISLPKNLVKGVVAISGIYDIEPITNTDINDVLRLPEDQIAVYSPIRLKFKNNCPFVIAFGNNETSEFKRQSKEFAAHLEQQCIVNSVLEIESRNHFDVVLDLANVDSQLFKLSRGFEF
ncbi:alpha/beta hydrolase [Psychrosphaera sp. B3R10]|uniref:alpha/beta hydrolase n=1 Tax=unclassified Psychrosphaera TaxID=2641570 RepID=UPI001C09FE79|nr:MULTISPECIES: alpha/beta hydrolase [unclassified Psychrosphaera]MBU2882807.1 alpha/beta hydrolase [Psychrosphaera sp. I2R16]MBU2988043.1 alpha/beta hydrolase [Psychrosphaera sp. B3R10]